MSPSICADINDVPEVNIYVDCIDYASIYMWTTGKKFSTFDFGAVLKSKVGRAKWGVPNDLTVLQLLEQKFLLPNIFETQSDRDWWN